MYLISQLWWYLLLSFLLGALIGYLLWRACNRPLIESRFERSRKDLISRVALLEEERSRFTTISVDAEGHVLRLKTQITALEADKDAALARAEHLSADAATAAKRLDDTNKKHAEDLKRATDELTADVARRHTGEVKKARDEVTASLSASHAAEVKRLQDISKVHETRVLAMTETGSSAKREIDEVKARHADELKKVREQTSADLTAKHTDEVKKARDAVTAEWTQKHAADLKKARDEVTAEWSAKHSAELQKARTDTASAATASHTTALKAAREEAAAVAARRHSEDLSRLQREHEAALKAHASDLAAARSASVSAKAVSAKTEALSAAPKQPATPQTTMAAASVAASAKKADDLKLIWGVGPELQNLLNGHGISRFEQIAAWQDKDIAWLDGVLPNFKGRAVSEKWVEQAAKLAAGWRPERPIGDKPKDILTGPRGGKADDLKLIWGVGPKLEQMLNGAGFYHFDQIAKWTDKEIEWVDTQLGDFAGRAVRDKWVDQCIKLAAGWRPKSDVGDKPQ